MLVTNGLLMIHLMLVITHTVLMTLLQGNGAAAYAGGVGGVPIGIVHTLQLAEAHTTASELQVQIHYCLCYWCRRLNG